MKNLMNKTYLKPNILYKPLLILLSLFLFSSLSLAGQLQPATITKITDGDTFWVNIDGQRTKLRLLGIDTPEKYSGYKLRRDAKACGVTQKYMTDLGRAATRYAENLVHVGDAVKLTTYGHGYYGRTLAMVYLSNGTCYNERVVADGYACVYKYHGHKSRQMSWAEFDKLNRLMQEAKEHRRGLWERDYRVMERLCE